jgi:PAS domain S-box-containing protein
MVIAPQFVVGRQVRELHSSSRASTEAPVKANDLGVGVLFDRLLDAVVIARLTTGRIVLWNRAAEKLFGYTAREAIGRSIEMLMPEPVARLHRSGLERYLRSGHGLIVDAETPVEMPARTRHGDDIRVELSLSELQSRPGERFALAIMRDVTHRKQLELTNLELAEARVARSDVEGAVIERDELLSAVAASLQSATDADEVGRLAAALFEFKRLEAGQVKLFRQSADLVDILHAACDAARMRAAGRRLLVYVPPTAPTTCDVDRTREVLDTILDTTLAHAPVDSRIVVSLEVLPTQTVQLTVQAEGGAEQPPRSPSNVALYVGRSLLRRQAGNLSIAISSSGSLQVVMTLPGSPQPPRRRLVRPRSASRAMTAS